VAWLPWLSLFQHHGETADPALLEWIKGTLDHLLNLGPWTVVLLLGALIALIPVGLVGFYLWQQRRTRPEPGDLTP